MQSARRRLLKSSHLQDAMATATCTPELNDSFTREFLSCSICWDIYDDKMRQPKLLSCHHTFCKSCLKKLIRSKNILQCSTCRKDTVLSDGVTSLQTNFYVMYMKQKFGDQLRVSNYVCHKHALQPLSFFCKTCKLMVCRDCIVLAHQQTDGHDLQELEEVRSEYIVSIQQQRIKADEAIRQRQGYLSCLRAELDTMEIASEAALEKIDKDFDQLVEIVNTRRQLVKEQLKEAHETRHRSVNEQLAEIDNQTTKLIAIREKLEDATCKGQIGDLVEVAADENIQSQIKDPTNDVELNLGKNYLNVEVLKTEACLQQLVSDVGEIKEQSMLPSKISIEPVTATAGLQTRLKLKVSSHTGETLLHFTMGMSIIDPEGDELENTAIDNKDGTYTVLFTPQISGAHLCTTTFLGQKIASSCISVAVRSNDPLKVVGTMGKEKGKFMYPCSLKTDKYGDLYIVDEGNQRIQKFYSDGSIDVISLATSSKGARTFDCAIDFKANELICSKVVVDQRKAWADTIQKYSLDGEQISQFTNSEMKKALYVTVNSMDQIIVSDYHLSKLFIYDQHGNLIKEIGRSGYRQGEFKEPAFVCVGKDDDIIVSDCGNSRVQVLNKLGDFKYEIGKKGNGKGQLQGPSGVTTDKHGHILVTDRINNRIQIYTYEGAFVSCIESTGNKLRDPRGLAVSNDGCVYVADQKNHCIKQFRYM